MIFAEQLRHIMEVEHLTAKDVAERCGMLPVSISRYLSGDRAPNVRDAIWIFNCLGYETLIKKKESASNDVDIRKNASGCYDPTAYRAIKNVEKERFSKVLQAIFSVCDLADFHVEGRIKLYDKKTGKLWK